MNNAPFYVGQKVIRTSTSDILIKGETYTISEMKYCCSRWGWRLNVEEAAAKLETCECGNRNKYRFAAKNFAPITEQYADMTASIAAGMSETKEVPDKVIIPSPEVATS